MVGRTYRRWGHALILVLVMIISATLSGGLIFALFGATSIGGVTAFGICYGFFSGGGWCYGILLPACVWSDGPDFHLTTSHLTSHASCQLLRNTERSV